jgi:hypothetical protein
MLELTMLLSFNDEEKYSFMMISAPLGHGIILPKIMN